MKRIMLSFFSVFSLGFSDVVTVLPFVSYIDYDKSSSKSIKDSSSYGGIYANIGNLNYLLEFSYTYLDTKFKDTNINNLKQNDLTAVYGKYFKNFMFKFGIHYISNNEDKAYIDLGGGYIGIAGVAGYHWFLYDKLTYGVDGYYSNYADGNNTTTITADGVTLYQVSPYISYSKAININTRDTLSVKLNYISTQDYNTKSYTSYEIFNTFLYKKFYNTIRYMGGKAKSAVFGGGFIVFNSKDLITQAIDVTLGYYFKPQLTLDFTYSSLKYDEYFALLKDSKRDTYTITFGYRWF